MSRFTSPAYPAHTQRDRAVLDQVRPSEPITCDDCARPWQAGATFWRRSSRPAWIYCAGCKRGLDKGEGDWEPISEADMQALAEFNHEPLAEADKPGSFYQHGAINAAADRVLRAAGMPGGFNHISEAQRAKAKANIKAGQTETKQEGKAMPTGQYKRTPEMEAKRLETRRRNQEAKARAASKGEPSANIGEVTITQEVTGKPETRTTTTVPMRPALKPVAEPELAGVLAAIATLRRLNAEARRAAVELIG